jgi:tRNA A37 methylthiotransferase MiaB
VDSQFLLGRLLSSPDGGVIYSTDPYDPEVQLVFLNTCGFISSGREEMFQTIEKLFYHRKKVCLLGCAVQYFTFSFPTESNEHKKRQTFLEHPQLSLLSWNDLKTASIPKILQGFKSQTFHNFERLDPPRALTNLDQ